MKRLTAALSAVLTLSGCGVTDLSGVITDGTPVVEPRKLDCNLIFPPVTVDP